MAVSVDNKLVTGASIKKLKEYIDTRIGDVAPSSIKHSNRNLLDNPFFSVAQAGYVANHGGSTYASDRWWIIRGVPFVSKGDYINIGTGAEIGQIIEAERFRSVGDTMTVSIMLGDGTVVTGTGTVSTETVMIDDSRFTVKMYYKSSYYISTGIGIYAKSYVTVKAVKLELGSSSTLQYDSAPDYATELLKCQRYYVVYNDVFGIAIANGSAEYGITLPVEMRIPPSVSVMSAQYYSNGWRNMNTESVYSTKNSIRLGYSSIPQYAVTAVTFNASADF